MSNIKISACLVVHNEERLIVRCLDSLKGVVDEIIVVHDGPCQDQTLNISAKYQAKFFEREFIGVAEPHRPFAYEQASGSWILQIDADECLSEELRKNIRLLVENETVSAYEFVWPLWNGQEAISSGWPRKRCFFRKNKLSFLGLPQFVAEIEGAVILSPLVLEHKPEYNNYQWSKFKTKWLPWAKLQAQYCLKDFPEINKFNYSGNTWPRQIIIRKKFPLLVLPFDFVLVFFRTLWSGAYRQELIGFKLALMQGAYRAAVDYYLFKFK
jgi:glycosyltransferase involved in cell wall biosynthesis